MATCPTCDGTGSVPEHIANALNTTGQTRGARTCHCDGPPHSYDPTWCPRSGPVTR